MLILDRCCPFFPSKKTAEVNGKPTAIAEEQISKLLKGEVIQLIFTKLFEGVKFSEIGHNTFEAHFDEPRTFGKDQFDKRKFEINGKVAFRIRWNNFGSSLVFTSGLQYGSALVETLFISTAGDLVVQPKENSNVLIDHIPVYYMNEFKKIEHLKNT